MNAKMYKEYKRRIAKAKAVVDNNPPKFPIDCYYKTDDLIIYMNRVRGLDKENMELLRVMNVITRMGGEVDCWLPKIKYKTKYDNQDVLNKVLVARNKHFLHRLNNVRPIYSTASLLKSWKEVKKLTQHRKRFPEKSVGQIIGLPSHQDHCIVTDVSLVKEMNPHIRTKCFFEIEIQGENQKLGSIQIELYDDIVPQTCTNFAELCRGFNGLSYKNTPFHRIVSGYWCQGGDVTKFNGSGGTSVYGKSFENENYNLCHAGPGILSMCSDNENRSNSKFNLTFRKLESVNERHVVFGKVTAGLSNIYKIEEFGTKTGKPFKNIIVSNCGIVSRSMDKIHRTSNNI